MREALVVIPGVVDQAVAREADALCTTIAALVVDIAFFPGAARLFGKQAVIVVEAAAANAFTRANIPQVALFRHPASIVGLGLGDVIAGQLAIRVDIESHVIFVGVGAVLLNRNAAGRRRGR